MKQYVIPYKYKANQLHPVEHRVIRLVEHSEYVGIKPIKNFFRRLLEGVRSN